jgi:hypothetical protein
VIDASYDAKDTKKEKRGETESKYFLIYGPSIKAPYCHL